MIVHYKIHQVSEYINWIYFFHAWGFQPNMQPLNNIGKNLVYSGSKQNVKLTMCAGKVLYEDGEFRIGEEPAVIYKKANEIIESMKD